VDPCFAAVPATLTFGCPRETEGFSAFVRSRFAGILVEEYNQIGNGSVEMEESDRFQELSRKNQKPKQKKNRHAISLISYWDRSQQA
jgi:hypothetical protein